MIRKEGCDNCKAEIGKGGVEGEERIPEISSPSWLSILRGMEALEEGQYGLMVWQMLPKVFHPQFHADLKETEADQGVSWGEMIDMLNCMFESLPTAFEGPKRKALLHQVEVAKAFGRCHYAFIKDCVKETLGRDFSMEKASCEFAKRFLPVAKKGTVRADERMDSAIGNEWLKKLSIGGNGIDKHLAEITVLGYLWPLSVQAYEKLRVVQWRYPCEERFLNYVLLALNCIRVRIYQTYQSQFKGKTVALGISLLLKSPHVTCACLPVGNRMFTQVHYRAEDLSNLLYLSAVPDGDLSLMTVVFRGLMGGCHPVISYLNATEGKRYPEHFQGPNLRDHFHDCCNPKCGKGFGKNGDRLQMKVCRRCKAEKLRVRAFYCSEACHRAHWPVHAQLHFYFRQKSPEKD